MGEEDVHRQSPNVARMKMLGAQVVAVTSGSKTLKDATNEAIRDWINNADDTYYIIGSSIGPHPYPDLVTQLQSVISEELKAQLQSKINKDYPDNIIACVGGGSNAAGIFYHYLNDNRVNLTLAEAAGKGVDSGFTAATSIKGRLGIIHGCKTLLMQNEDGQIIEPYSISAGLDYPGIGPIHANLIQQKRAIVIPITDEEALNAVFTLSRNEGIIPALESAHALAVLDKMSFHKNQVIVIGLSGRGDKDLNTYLKYLELNH
jgi:tryptophan synthase beta subunit